MYVDMTTDYDNVLVPVTTYQTEEQDHEMCRQQWSFGQPAGTEFSTLAHINTYTHMHTHTCAHAHRTIRACPTFLAYNTQSIPNNYTVLCVLHDVHSTSTLYCVSFMMYTLQVHCIVCPS